MYELCIVCIIPNQGWPGFVTAFRKFNLSIRRTVLAFPYLEFQRLYQP